MSPQNTTYTKSNNTELILQSSNTNKMTTSEVLNSLVSDKLLGKYNLLRVLVPSTALGNQSPANLIPAVKSWLGTEQTELAITMDNIQIDMLTNIYQHYSQRVMNVRADDDRTDNIVDMLSPLNGKLALFNVTKDDINIPRYAAYTLRKYESIITGVSVDDRSNIIIPIKQTPVLHIHIPEKGRTLNEKYIEYRFKLLEFGKTPAHIFIKQIQTPSPETNSTHKSNMIIGLEFTVDETEFVSDARLAMIIKYISGFQILLGSL